MLTMTKKKLYTTQLQAGLGQIDETKILLTLWEPGMSSAQLYQKALESGRFPTVTARRLRNIVVECFSPRYLINKATPAAHLKQLSSKLSNNELIQLMFLFTCRATPILADFVQQIYWSDYTSGHAIISNDRARLFVEKAIDEGKTSKPWSEGTIRRVSGYITGCCADFGLLESGQTNNRKIIPFRLLSNVVAYLAYDLHFSDFSDTTLVKHDDWNLFGVSNYEILEELKKLSLKGLLVLQAAGDIVRISWKYKNMEEFCDVIAQN